MNAIGGLEIQESMRAADELRKRSLKECKQAGRHKKRPALNFSITGGLLMSWRA
jgi:hypothetical protein